MDRIIGRIAFRLPRKLRRAVAQGVPGFVENLMRNLVRSLYYYEQTDVALAKRLARFIEQDGVTHVKMSFGSIGSLALEAQKHTRKTFDYLVTFQGDEEFAGLAQACGVIDVYRRRVNEAVRNASWPAIVLSRSYASRLVDELGLDGSRLEILYCGIELPKDAVAPRFLDFDGDLSTSAAGSPHHRFRRTPGEREGIDLLLYADEDAPHPRRPFPAGRVRRDGERRRLSERDPRDGDTSRLRAHQAGAVSVATRNALFAALPLRGLPFDQWRALRPRRRRGDELRRADGGSGLRRRRRSGRRRRHRGRAGLSVLGQRRSRAPARTAVDRRRATCGARRQCPPRRRTLSTSRMVDGILDHVGLPHRALPQARPIDASSRKSIVESQ